MVLEALRIYLISELMSDQNIQDFIREGQLIQVPEVVQDDATKLQYLGYVLYGHIQLPLLV